MTTETPIQLIRSVRDALRDWGADNDDTSINGIDARDYLTELLDRTNRILKDFYPEEYTDGKALIDAAERVAATYDAECPADELEDAAKDLSQAYANFNHGTPAYAEDNGEPTAGDTIIVTGNPIDGIEFFGPFKTNADAVAVASRWSSHEVDWWTAILQPAKAANG